MTLKIYFPIGLCLLTLPALSQTFTPGNIAVLQVGDGTGALSSNATPMFVKEFTPGGTAGITVTIPTTGSTQATESGSASSDGQINRSFDGDRILVSGYAAPSGATGVVANTTYNRVVDAVSNNGTVTLVGSAAQSQGYNTNNIRSATAFGSTIYTGGTASTVALGGIRIYTTTGATALSTTPTTNARNVGIFNGNLYYSTSSGTSGIYQVGTGLPTSGPITATLVFGVNNAYGFSFNPAGNVCYVADDNNGTTNGGGIRKYTLSGGTWTLAYTFTAGASGAIGVRGLVVDYSGAAPVLYATTNEASTAPNRLVTVTDNGAAGITTTLATSPANTQFRGVVFTPNPVGTWIGTTSTDVTNTLNWTSGTIPTTSLNVIVPKVGVNYFPVVASGSSISSNDLNVYTGATLAVNAGGTLTVAGNITNNGTLNAANGSVQLTGSTAQTVAAGTFTGNALGSLTVNNSAGVTLSTPLAISNTLTLTAGILANGSNTISIANTAAGAVSGGSSTAYVTGSLSRTQSATAGDSYFYPVGSSNRFRPVRITNPAAGITGTNSFGVTYSPAAYSNTTATNPAYHVSTLEYWDIARQTGADAMNVSLITDNDAASAIGNRSTVQVGHYNGATWDNLGNNSGNTAYGSGSEITTTGVSTFSPFTFISADAANPLPVRIAAFDLYQQANSSVQLSWQLIATDGMQNISLERKTGSRDFETLKGFAGGSRTTVTDHYNDESPAQGLNVYRLKVTDLSGKMYYSTSRAVSISNGAGGQATVSLYPNPVRSSVNILWDKSGASTTVALYNSIGQQLQTTTTTGGNLSLDLSQFAAGFYFIQWTQGGQTQRLPVEKIN